MDDFNQDPQRAQQLVTYGESKPLADLETAELAGYTMLANLLLNLDEVVTKN